MCYKIVKKYEHYEVHVNGKFYCSADTKAEALNEIRNIEESNKENK